jgi:Uncharacterized protein conserved in bacteria (DUF2325)
MSNYPDLRLLRKPQTRCDKHTSERGELCRAAADMLQRIDRAMGPKAGPIAPTSGDFANWKMTGGVRRQTSAIPWPPRLDGVTLLYVGGHPHQVAHLRAVAEEFGAGSLHHDGGVEHHLNLLAGLASQADLVVFPVDCISHHAAQVAKQLCRQAGKRFMPLRSAGATSLLAALRRPKVTGLADAADWSDADHHVGRLDHGGRLHARLQPKLLGCLVGDR